MTIVNSEAYVALRQAGVSQEIACRYAQDFADRDWRLARLEAELADLSVGAGAKAT